MASRKKAANDTVTFTKDELISKVKAFLEAEGACDGDWLNKVKAQFLGLKECTIEVEVKIPATVQLQMACDGVPSKAEINEFIQAQMNEGDWCGFDDIDEDNYEIVKVTKKV